MVSAYDLIHGAAREPVDPRSEARMFVLAVVRLRAEEGQHGEHATVLAG